MEEYECLMYVEFLGAIENLYEDIASLFSVVSSDGNVSTDALEIDVLTNDDNYFDENVDSLDSIYLTYSFILDIGSSKSASKEDFVSSVSKLLEFFWSEGCPAVARCEFSELLPYDGEGMQHQLDIRS
jgi:hypothetical protein